MPDVAPLLAVAGQVALIVALAALGLVAVRFLYRRLLRMLERSVKMDAERRQQFVTLMDALRWLLYVLIVSIASVMVLDNFVDIGPLLAGAGVAGLAISLAAQTLIQDLIGGIIILLENQYAVGDAIQVGDVAGTVEKLTLRATYLRDLQGQLHIVPNGMVRIVSNKTKEWSRAVVEIGVAYEEELERVLTVLEEAVIEAARDPRIAPYLLDTPTVTGPISLDDWAVKVRVMVKTEPGKQWTVGRVLRQRILEICAREQIVLPYPRQEVWLRREVGTVSPPRE